MFRSPAVGLATERTSLLCTVFQLALSSNTPFNRTHFLSCFFPNTFSTQSALLHRTFRLTRARLLTFPTSPNAEQSAQTFRKFGIAGNQSPRITAQQCFNEPSRRLPGNCKTPEHAFPILHERQRATVPPIYDIGILLCARPENFIVSQNYSHGFPWFMIEAEPTSPNNALHLTRHLAVSVRCSRFTMSSLRPARSHGAQVSFVR